MQLTYSYKPIRFFLIVFLISGIAGFSAAYCSYQKELQVAELLFMFATLVAPCITALAMIFGSKNNQLKDDFWDRLSLSRIKLSYLPMIFLLTPLILFLATTLSLLFGKSAKQFALSTDFHGIGGMGILSLLLPLFLAPAFEELGWRGYGVDSLRAHFNLFITSLLFAFLWGLWHVPLFFIKGFYQNELWNTSIIYSANFFASMLPATFLINWIYYQNNRSIIAAMLFHFMLNLSAVLFQTQQFTKCIVTILLLAVSVIIVVKDKKFFFNDNQTSWF